MVINIQTEAELIAFAKNFAVDLQAGDILFLEGPLGAGKTTFVKGIALGLGIKKRITSPTYTIVKEYENKLCHLDAYRLEQSELDLDYYLDNKFIICAEWPTKLEQNCLSPTYLISIDYEQDGRVINISRN
ncbi:MAG: tRNA (adenosine(37)-N6)-threonylcarbamoyltransferase complex ATPase subunit type 1 TsaE [Mycoplasmatales bacterium]